MIYNHLILICAAALMGALIGVFRGYALSERYKHKLFHLQRWCIIHLAKWAVLLSGILVLIGVLSPSESATIIFKITFTLSWLIIVCFTIFLAPKFAKWLDRNQI